MSDAVTATSDAAVSGAQQDPRPATGSTQAWATSTANPKRTRL